MTNKSTLVIPSAYNDSIICICQSECSYVDEFYFEEVMGEDKSNTSNKNFAVTTSALRVDWIMQNEGKQFLQALLRTEDETIFRSKTVVVITEFLYMHYRRKILRGNFPIYILQLILFFVPNLIVNKSAAFKNVTYSLNLVSCIYQFIIVCRNIHNVGAEIFKRPWVYFDIYYILSLFVISISYIHESFDTDEPVG